jgi:hypothetical protein
MPHGVSNFNDPLVREAVLQAWDHHRHNHIINGKEMVRKGKYRQCATELLQDYGLLVDPTYLKYHVVSTTHTPNDGDTSSSPHHTLVLVQAELQADYDAEGWPQRKAGFVMESWQSQIWSRFPNSAATGSIPPRSKASFAAAAAAPSYAAASFAVAPPSPAATAQFITVMRNIHSELVNSNQSLRAIASVLTSRGVTASKLKHSIELLQNGNPEEGELAQCFLLGPTDSTHALQTEGWWINSSVPRAYRFLFGACSACRR